MDPLLAMMDKMGGFGPSGAMGNVPKVGAADAAINPDFMSKMMQQEKDKLNAAKARKGQKAQNKRSRAALMMEFSAMRRQATDMETSSGIQLRRTYINFAYPPSTRTVVDLISINIADLRLETHHSGKVLFVKTFGYPTRITAVQNAVEDELGDVERIAVYNADPLAPPDMILPRNAIFAVKEPYYKGTADGGVQVRVDHPSDIVRLQSFDLAVPVGLAPRLVELDKSAASYKSEGNVAYSKKDYETAIDAYTNALEACGDSDSMLKYDLYRNRAMANLCLKRHERALSDALAAILPDDNEDEQKLKELNTKAYFRAGRSAYELGRFSAAETYYKKMSELAPGDSDAEKELKRTALRLREASTGVYDFSAMSKSASKKHTHLDHASSTERIEIRDAGSNGRGLFAKVDIKAGELVLCEKAFSSAFAGDKGDSVYVLMNLNTNRISMGKHAMLLFNTVKKLLHSPVQASRYFDLYDGGYEPKCAVTDVDGVVAVDTFRAQAIIEHNSFGCPDVRSTKKDESESSGKSREMSESSGAWIMASYANHSCAGNAMRSFIGDMMIIRATKDIAAGEEILQPYRHPEVEQTKTQMMLQKHWGFKCKCVICTAEDSGSAAQRRQRAKLSKELLQLLDSNKITTKYTPTDSTIANGQRLMASLREAYSTPAFRDVPKLGLASLSMWLMQSKHANDAGLVIESACKILQYLGYGLVNKGHSVIFDHTHGLLHNLAIDAAMHAAQAHMAAGQFEKSAAFEQFARKLYTIAYGEIHGFHERYNK